MFDVENLESSKEKELENQNGGVQQPLVLNQPLILDEEIPQKEETLTLTEEVSKSQNVIKNNDYQICYHQQFVNCE